ncbi:MAG TPA: PSD1 and planctomycete cytochrome C domain-containing protein [Planctomycetota bacterium]|nr:PSD1 and planctomycete cytochrome C domain-containing protein [Planctomycetota bacterium]
MPNPWILASSAALLLAFAAAQEPTPAPSPRAAIDFDRDVLPVLGAKCLGCHSGPHPKARLDLLSRTSALRGGSSGESALVPGDPEASRLIAVVDGSDAELRMPPRGELLSKSEVETLRAWIRADAPWSASAEALSGKPWHWAYRAPIAMSPPPVRDAAWRENPIDAFVLAAIEREGLAHAPRASRRSLARRLSLSVTGLLPDPSAVDAFLVDQRPDAIGRYVDDLLASPHYGERMARMWLDLGRYADTNGYEKDARRSMSPWRDWVIEAFNRNLPFDRFTLEQLAGDLLPDTNLQTRIATGFHRNTMTNEEGGVDPEEFRVEAVHDRVNTTASVWLGSTLGCAQCHDHKFDPFSIDDYYAFFAFFDDDVADTTILSSFEQRASGAMLVVPPAGQAKQYEQATLDLAEARRVLATSTPALEAAQARWEAGRRGPESVWSTLMPLKCSADSGATLTTGSDGSIAAGGTESDIDTYRLEFTFPKDGLSHLRLEVLPRSDGEKRGLGRTPSGNFVLSEISAERLTGDERSGETLVFHRAHADFEQRNGNEAWLAAHTIDGNPKTGWAIAGATDVAHELVLETAETLGTESGTSLRLTLEQRYGHKHTLARFRVSACSSRDAALCVPLPAAIATILGKDASQRTSEESEALAAHYRSISPLLAQEQSVQAHAEAELAAIGAPTTLVMQANEAPRTTRVHRKGNFLDPGDEAPPALPRVFGALPKDLPPTRLGLARWLASAQNPLFARVFVNHVWELDFGRGLVATPDDFGTQGDPPSHPELLDWLACRFIESGYDVKALQRLIVTSETFLQDSRFDERSAEHDPANRWLARGPRFRLEAEALRDVALCASGLLVRQIGGPSVFPPQPEGVWTMIYSNDRWMNSTGPDRYRRGLYTFARRTAPYPSATVFDAPSREVSCPRRSRTNTPLQALTTLNDPQFVEAAIALARRMVLESDGTDVGALFRGFALCLCRTPHPDETRTLLELYSSQLQAFSRDEPSCTVFLANGPAAAGDEDCASTAAWAMVANVLLNLDEMQEQE